MSYRADVEDISDLRQRKAAGSDFEELKPTFTHSKDELTPEEVRREMDSPITRRDILSLLAVVIPLLLLILIQGKFFEKQNVGKNEPNVFLDYLESMRN